MSDDLQLIAKCVLIALGTAWILISYAKACKCDVCGEPYGVWRRTPYPGADVQLCRHHAQLYDSVMPIPARSLRHAPRILEASSVSQATDILDAPDEMIRIIATREDGIVHYGIGRNSTVTWRGQDRYLCHTCSGNDRWATSDHKGCAHIQRVIRYREEHPATAGSGA